MASAGEKIGPGDYFKHSGCLPFAVPYELCVRSHDLLFQNQVAIKMKLLWGYKSVVVTDVQVFQMFLFRES